MRSMGLHPGCRQSPSSVLKPAVSRPRLAAHGDCLTNGASLCQGVGGRGFRVVDHGAVDDVGEASLEAAHGFFVGLAGGSFALV